MNRTDVLQLAITFGEAWVDHSELRVAAFVIMIQTTCIAFLLIIMKC